MPGTSPEELVSPQTSLIPRPEYPRPQFVRSEWMSLNGWWKFRIDDDIVGLEQRWFASTDYPAEILVPFSLETKLSGIGDRSFHPCVWYQRTFEIPSGWSGKEIRINFGAVDYRATVWINGIVVGWHEGGSIHPPRETALGIFPCQHFLRADDRHLAERLAGAG